MCLWNSALSTKHGLWKLHPTASFDCCFSVTQGQQDNKSQTKYMEKSATKIKKNTEYPTFPPLPTKREVITYIICCDSMWIPQSQTLFTANAGRRVACAMEKGANGRPLSRPVHIHQVGPTSKDCWWIFPKDRDEHKKIIKHIWNNHLDNSTTRHVFLSSQDVESLQGFQHDFFQNIQACYVVDFSKTDHFQMFNKYKFPTFPKPNVCSILKPHNFFSNSQFGSPPCSLQAPAPFTGWQIRRKWVYTEVSIPKVQSSHMESPCFVGIVQYLNPTSWTNHVFSCWSSESENCWHYNYKTTHSMVWSLKLYQARQFHLDIDGYLPSQHDWSQNPTNREVPQNSRLKEG